MFTKKVKNNYVIIAMTIPQAMELLELKSGFSKDELKKSFRAKALKSHPDRGGSEDQMKLLNTAYELLEKSAGNISIEDFDTRYKERKKKEAEVAKVLLKNYEDTFDKKSFTTYLEKITGKKFHIATDTKESDYGVQYKVTLTSEDKETRFDIYFYTDFTSVMYTKSLGGGSDEMTYPMMISTSVLHNNRDVKLTKSNFNRSSKTSLLLDPKEILPEAKIKKMMQQKVDRKYQRRDMQTALTKKLNAKLSGDFAYIPVGNDFKIVLNRTVFMKEALWYFNGFYKGNKRLYYVALTLPESEDTINALYKIQEELKSLDGSEMEAQSKKLLESLRTKS